MYESVLLSCHCLTCHHFILLIILINGYYCWSDRIEYGMASYWDQIMHLSCGLQPFETQEYPIFPNKTIFTQVNIFACPLPAISYADVFEKMNISVSSVEEITIFEIPHESEIKGSHFEGLSLQKITIKCLETNTLLPIKRDVLESLKTVIFMSFENVILAPLPLDAKVIVLLLERGRSEGSFGGCNNLRAMSISRWDVSGTKRNWLGHCKRLQKLWMYRMPSIYTVIWVLEGAKSLIEATIKDCDLPLLKMELFKHVINLKSLNMQSNNIGELFSRSFEPLTVLEELDLSYNQLADNKYTVASFYTLPALQKLNLERNSLPNFCNYTNSSALMPIKSLSLSGTMISNLCFSNWHSLERLNLSANNIQTFQLNDLSIKKRGILEVDLRKNNINKVNFTKEDYELLKSNKGANLTVLMDSSIDCDCHGAWLAKALREQLLTFDSFRCTDGVPVTDQETSIMECDKYDCDVCTCRRAWSDNLTRADCTLRGLNLLPELSDLREMQAGGNVIDTIRIQDLPGSLKYIDLSSNRISYVEADVASRLFDDPERIVRIGSNPIICDCDNQPFIAELQTHRVQVADYNNITCVGDGKKIQDVVTDLFCTPKNSALLVTILAGGGMFVGLIALFAALYCRYEKPIKIYLYARGICLCCMAEDEFDEDKDYDAFISFSHEDERFVMEELLPELEKTFKICVHYRDWLVGDMIPTQITRSVESSRRTIIVLSKRFVKSLWGLLEFRTAHVSALSEGRLRVIVIVIDDVTEDDTLDLQLKGYLRTNTYLKWEDPWFWDKLKYAMPRMGFVAKEIKDKAMDNIIRRTQDLPALDVGPQ